jgi:hypothetical protein
MNVPLTTTLAFAELRAIYPPSPCPAKKTWRRIEALRRLGHQGPYVWLLTKITNPESWHEGTVYVDRITTPLHADEIGQRYGAGQYQVIAHEWNLNRKKMLRRGAVAVAAVNVY